MRNGQMRHHPGMVVTLDVAQERICARLERRSELAGFALDFWAGLFGPANLPASIKDKLAALTVEVLDDPDLKARLAEQVFAIRKLSSYAFNAFIAAEHERAKKIIEDGQITLAR